MRAIIRGDALFAMVAGKARSYGYEPIECKQPDGQHHQSNNDVVAAAVTFPQKRPGT